MVGKSRAVPGKAEWCREKPSAVGKSRMMTEKAERAPSLPRRKAAEIAEGERKMAVTPEECRGGYERPGCCWWG